MKPLDMLIEASYRKRYKNQLPDIRRFLGFVISDIKEQDKFWNRVKRLFNPSTPPENSTTP